MSRQGLLVTTGESFQASFDRVASGLAIGLGSARRQSSNSIPKSPKSGPAKDWDATWVDDVEFDAAERADFVAKIRDEANFNFTDSEREEFEHVEELLHSFESADSLTPLPHPETVESVHTRYDAGRGSVIGKAEAIIHASSSEVVLAFLVQLESRYFQ